MAERPLFRRCKNAVRGVQISEEEALADTTLRRQMTDLGSITGMELPTGEITDTQRNIILQHHSSSVFQKNYASRYMPDTQAAYRGLKPQTALMRVASGMSRTIDSRRLKRLNLAQQAEVDRHPEGLPVAEQEDLQAAEYVFVERVQAINALFTFATSSTEEECQRRAVVINALIALCKKQENQGFRRRKADIKVKEEQTSPSVSLPPDLSKTFPVECKAT
ncbi:hypothetical protein MMC28_004268 [Mycoblastus sanguinarius]|nr:hypothetical protein [Mycoblastus sanguinarius]